MSHILLETTEYSDPTQAPEFDVYIPTDGFVTNLRAEIHNTNVPYERWGSVGAAVGFDIDGQEIFFRPTYFPSLIDGDSVNVHITWSVAGEAQHADVLVRGRTGNEPPDDRIPPRPPYEGTEGPDILSGYVSAAIYRFSVYDRFFGLGGDDIIFAGNGIDEVHGGPGDDYIDGGGGDVGLVEFEGDRLYGDDGNDIIIGGGGGEGGDFLYGGTGDDLLIGSANIVPPQGDYLYGEAGDDRLAGLEGADLLDGGEGLDTADYSASPEPVVVLLSQADAAGIAGRFRNSEAGGYSLPEDGPDPLTPPYDAAILSHAHGDTYVSIEGVIGSRYGDYVYGSGTGSTVELGDGDDTFDNNHLAWARDHVSGGAGDDRIWGGGGGDWLYGNEGDDRLWGEDGFDTLEGGPGDDILWGGSGADVFRFISQDDGNDVIRDFEIGLDKIDLPDFAPTLAVLAAQTLLPNGRYR